MGTLCRARKRLQHEPVDAVNWLTKVTLCHPLILHINNCFIVFLFEIVRVTSIGLNGVKKRLAPVMRGMTPMCRKANYPVRPIGAGWFGATDPLCRYND